MKYAFPCLYCPIPNNVEPRTEEHVIQRTFGAEMVLADDVCNTCNSHRLSKLDTELKRYIDLCVHKKLNLGLGETKIENGTWVTILLDQKQLVITSVVLPQLVKYGNYGWQYYSANKGNCDISVIVEELRNCQELAITKRVIAPEITDGEPVQCAIIRTAHRTYSVRAPDADSAEELYRRIITGQFSFDTRPSAITCKRITGSSQSYHCIEQRNGKVRQALAKIAVNFICHRSVLGPEIARSDDFIRIRRFIISEYSDENDNFVELISSDRATPRTIQSASLFARKGFHTIAFHGHNVYPSVLVALYERPLAIVRLTGEKASASKIGKSFFGLFNYNNRKFDIFTSEDLDKIYAAFANPASN